MRRIGVLVRSVAAGVACGALLGAMADTAVALDVVSRRVPELDGPGATRLRVVLSGTIRPGDAAKVARAFADLPVDQFDGVVLNSPGGAMTEGLRIGEMFERLLIRVIVREPFRCWSACFFVLVGAPMRSAHGPPQPVTLAVHRGSLRPDVVDKVSTDTLERMLVYEQEHLPRWLDARGVPPDIIASIVAGKVVPLVALSQDEIDRVGPRSPAYDAWMEGRCPGSGKSAAWTVREVPPQVPDAQLAAAEERRECEIRRVEAERRYQQFALRTELDVASRRQAPRQTPSASSRGADGSRAYLRR